MDIPFEIIYIILDYISDVVYKRNLLSMNNKFFSIRNYIVKEIKEKKKFVHENFSKDILDLFGNSLHLFPVLGWKERFCGSTGYLDKMGFKDIEYPMMIGIDGFKRSFIVLCYRLKDDDLKYYCLDTFFQRYSDDKFTWSHATNSGYSELIDISGYFYNKGVIEDKNLRIKIKDLLETNDIYMFHRSIVNNHS